MGTVTKSFNCVKSTQRHISEIKFNTLLKKCDLQRAELELLKFGFNTFLILLAYVQQ